MEKNGYVAFFETIPGESGYCVVVPDIPGFHSAGDTLEDAAKNAAQGMASHVELLLEQDVKIAAPRTLAEIQANWDGWTDWQNDTGGNFVVGFVPLLRPLAARKAAPAFAGAGQGV
ncbi:MAG: type II toxin-antitoxin system HicB family antitoxin [Spirochaetes bacterium]|nr:type II toxin-antitoxin system HicB family antitoxin [Spirochaetota bacterium]